MRLEYKNINLYFKDSGKGNAIILLHGFLENSSIWDKFINPLAEQNRVISIDLLGHGKTSCLGYIHTMEEMALAVRAVLKHLHIKKYTLVGHSMGGYVALTLTDAFPEEIKGLCLVNSTAKEDSINRILNRDRAIKAVKQNHKAFKNMLIGNLFQEKNRLKFQNEIERLKKEASKMSAQSVIAALEGMKIRLNREHVLNNTTSYKKMMILGINDPVLNYKETVSQLKNTDVKKVVFPGGHMSYIENESLFLRVIMHFIDFL